MFAVRVMTSGAPRTPGSAMWPAVVLAVLLASTGCSAGSASSQMGVHIGIEVRDGAVIEGPRNIVVKRGGRFSLEVVADTVDEVHVHGYDISVDVAPGNPATVKLDADIPGVFDVELEDARQPLLTLEVR